MYVYVMYNNNKEVLYVGQTRDMHLRMTQHFGTQREDWKNEVVEIYYMNCQTEIDMNIYEIYLINKLKPKYNKSLLFEGETVLGLPFTLIPYNFKDKSANRVDVLTDKEKAQFKKLLKIYYNSNKSKMNTNYDKEVKEFLPKYRATESLMALSYSWYKNKESASVERVFRNTYTFLRKGTSKSTTWTGFGSEIIGEEYIKRFLEKRRDINLISDFSKIDYLAYIKNDIVYNQDREVDEFLSVLPLVRFIKSSSISYGKEINIYIPSLRMRLLLEKYLNGELLSQ